MNLRIVAGGSDSIVTGDVDALAWLDEFVSFEDVKAKRRERMGYYAGATSIRLFDRKRSTLPTGLIPLVVRGAEVEGIAVDVADGRTYTKPDPERIAEELRSEPLTMRPYQVDAILSATVQASFFGRGVIKIPTGGGKGRVAVAIAKAIPGRWLFCVHRGNLADDVARRWETLAADEPPAGFVGAGKWEVGERLTCATLQTLHRARHSEKFAGLAESIDGVIVDECHTAPAKSFYETIRKFSRAVYRVGLSGTPFDRGDRRSLMAVAAIGPTAYEISARTLIDAGMLSEPTIKILPLEQRESPQNSGDFRKVYEELVVTSTRRNRLVIDAMRKSLEDGGTPGMVFVRRIEHGKRLRDAARDQGLNVELVDGNKDTNQRNAAIKRLESGRIDFIISTKVFAEGVNVPELRTVVLAAGGKSVIETLQQVGRGSRRTDGKREFTVYDIGDKGNRWLNNHARERIRAMRREGFKCKVVLDLWELD